ncbi:MAG: SBDS family ribosome assembly factor, partial [Fervidobacterium sp.]
PTHRIENAMNEARVKIDEFKPIEMQIHSILSAIKDKIPIKLETREIAVKIPSHFAPKCFSALKNFKIIKQDWHTDGSFLAVLEIPAGLQEELEDLLNQLTKGDVDIRIISKK